MGHAANQVISEPLKAALLRKQRLCKSRNNDMVYKGNLVAYCHDMSALGTLVASSAKDVPPAPVNLQPISDSPLENPGSKTVIAATVAANSTYGEDVSGFLRASKSKLVRRAIPITGCLCLMGAAGLTWYLVHTPAELNTQQSLSLTDAAADNLLADSEVTESSTPTTQMSEPLVIEPPAPPEELPLAQTPVVQSETVSVTAQYAEEIDWLNMQNLDLRGQIVVLREETTSLHDELFQMELKELAVLAEAKATGKPPVTYQYVDVPLGTEVIYTPMDNPASFTENTPVDSAPAEIATDAPEEIAMTNEYGRSTVIASASSVMGANVQPWQPSVAGPAQVIAANIAIGQPTITPSVSGVMGSATQVYQPVDLPPEPILGSADGQISFDPESGFYIDPNYSETTESAPTINKRESFPPIPKVNN